MSRQNEMPPMSGTDSLRYCCGRFVGFIPERHLKIIAADPETADVMLLVRCWKNRFLAPARMVAHYIEVIEADPDDKVRDVCIPAQDFAKWGGQLPHIGN